MYIERLRLAQENLKEKHKGEIAQYMMQYEELRTLAVLHWEKILRLEARVAELESALADMTEKKEHLEEVLKEKEAELVDVWDKFEKKSMEFINERQAHRLQIEANQRLEEEIKDLKKQIADLL